VPAEKVFEVLGCQVIWQLTGWCLHTTHWPKDLRWGGGRGRLSHKKGRKGGLGGVPPPAKPMLSTSAVRCWCLLRTDVLLDIPV
jgi:hypothetical protein